MTGLVSEAVAEEEAVVLPARALPKPADSRDPFLWDEGEVDRFLADHGEDINQDLDGDLNLDELPDIDAGYADWVLRRKAILRAKKGMVVEFLGKRAGELYQLLRSEETEIINTGKQPTHGNEHFFEQIIKAEAECKRLKEWADKLLGKINQEEYYRDLLLQKFWQTNQDCIVTDADGIGSCELPSGTIRRRRLVDIAKVVDETAAIQYGEDHELPFVKEKKSLDRDELKLFLTSTGERYPWGWLETGRNKFQVVVHDIR